MSHPLDRPIWNALTSRHAALADGDDRARRYLPSVSPFAATRDETPESLRALADLAAPGETLVFLQQPAFTLPTGFTQTLSAVGVQMIADRSFEPLDDAPIVPLGRTDAADMLDLANLTRPGPFTLRAQELGGFWGVRDGGRLIAMAGERFRQPGFSEVSGVCTHPEARGRGFGRLLSLHVAGVVAARGETPYLHAFSTNETAIGLYKAIGFHVRSTMHVAALVRQ